MQVMFFSYAALALLLGLECVYVFVFDMAKEYQKLKNM